MDTLKAEQEKFTTKADLSNTISAVQSTIDLLVQARDAAAAGKWSLSSSGGGLKLMYSTSRSGLQDFHISIIVLTFFT
jgi:hypothetical protein